MQFGEGILHGRKSPSSNSGHRSLRGPATQHGNALVSGPFVLFAGMTNKQRVPASECEALEPGVSKSCLISRTSETYTWSPSIDHHVYTNVIAGMQLEMND